MKKDGEKQRSYKQKKKRRRIKVQESSSSNEKVFKMQSTLLVNCFFHGRVCQVEGMYLQSVYFSSHACHMKFYLKLPLEHVVKMIGGTFNHRK